MDISVVIPTRNRSDSLRRTLKALAEQSFPSSRFEVILVDNGSTDNTREVASSFQRSLSHFKLLSEPEAGAARARNRGLRESSGELVVLVDDDVIPAPQLLDEHWRAHQAHPDSAILGHVTFPWNGTESPFRWLLANRPGYLQSFRFADPNNVPFNHFYSCNVALPRSVLPRAGFSEGFRAYGFEDTDFGYRLVRAGVRIVFCPAAEGLHDFHRTFVRFAEDRFQAGQSFHRLLQEHPELKVWSEQQGTPFRRVLARALGLLAFPLIPLFDAGLPVLWLPVLGRACGCHLQYRFWQGFTQASRSAGAR